MNDDRDLQRAVTQVALSGLDEYRFALAGSGAIREHGIVDRLTRDVDLFTNVWDAAAFRDAVNHVTTTLTDAGYTVDRARETDMFATLHVADRSGAIVDVDLSYDWRAQDPAQLQVGPVLAVDDAVAAKAGAIYSREEPRDLIDVDAIRSSGRYTDDDLVQLVAGRDDGFDPSIYADQLEIVSRRPDARFHDYGITPEQLVGLRQRTHEFAEHIRHPEATTDKVSATDQLRALSAEERLDRLRTAGYLAPARDLASGPSPGPYSTGTPEQQSIIRRALPEAQPPGHDLDF
ncbi:nucleotidyl transferase AbiEii/AbiGii toxin family protein [Frondihabitans sp. 4ASC-45]|uniref:nucleotidyl transferase AbiEii/AbiGii toxin family protein n=1 Tax=Frondihabitans sp. 4ASC-45 TaxID=3111636 RepID=UPI003C26C24A